MLANEVLEILRRDYRLSANAQGVLWYVERLADSCNSHELAALYITDEQLANMVATNSEDVQLARAYGKVLRDATASGAIRQSAVINFETSLARLGV